jgi:hypothetical protein
MLLLSAVSTPGGMMPPLTPSSPYGGSCVGGAGLLHNLDTEGQIFVPRQMLLMARVRDHLLYDAAPNFHSKFVYPVQV